MIIQVPDAALEKVIEQEFIKVTTSSYSNKSHLEIAVTKAIQEVAKTKVLELLKSDPKYLETLNKVVTENILIAFELVAKRIAKDLGEAIVSSIEGEFKTYSD